MQGNGKANSNKREVAIEGENKARYKGKELTTACRLPVLERESVVRDRWKVIIMLGWGLKKSRGTRASGCMR